jgi:hypothetical protein
MDLSCASSWLLPAGLLAGGLALFLGLRWLLRNDPQ